MAAGTFLSRLTGFARVVVVAYVLGITGLSDAYNFANNVPNIFYDLLLGGVLSATLVPVFVEALGRRDRREGSEAISAVVTTITVALAALTAVLYFLAPFVIRLYLVLNHTSVAPDERAIGTSLLHLFAPQLFFLGAIAVSTALLNARRQFAAAAFSPVLNNIIAIAAVLAVRVVATRLDLGSMRHDSRALMVLGLGTTAGYAVQFLAQVPAMVRSGVRIRPVWNLRHPAVRTVARLSLWLFGAVLTNQISLNIILVVAGRIPGDFSAYNIAFQFFQLPYALFAVSVATALTPDLAERWTRRDRVGFQRRIIIGLRVTLAVLVPAAAGYAIVAQPLVVLAVRHGRTSPLSAHLVGELLAVFAIGLPGFSAFLLLMRAYQAMQDTRSMFWVYLFENALTLVAALSLYPLWGVRGLALGWVGAYSVASIVAAVSLRRRIGSLGGMFTLRALGRIASATAVMVGVLAAVSHVLPHGVGVVALVVRLVAEVVAGTVTYVAMARWLGIKELRPVLRMARRLVP